MIEWLHRAFPRAAVAVVVLLALMSLPADALAAPPPAPSPYGDPNLVSMFDGTTLTGWTTSKPGGWTVVKGAIHGTGKAGRGWIYYSKQQAGTFRWIFNVRQVKGNHAPTVLI